jgi:hypothetical protein
MAAFAGVSVRAGSDAGPHGCPVPDMGECNGLVERRWNKW